MNLFQIFTNKTEHCSNLYIQTLKKFLLAGTGTKENSVSLVFKKDFVSYMNRKKESFHANVHYSTSTFSLVNLDFVEPIPHVVIFFNVLDS